MIFSAFVIISCAAGVARNSTTNARAVRPGPRPRPALHGLLALGAARSGRWEGVGPAWSHILCIESFLKHMFICICTYFLHEHMYTLCVSGCFRRAQSHTCIQTYMHTRLFLGVVVYALYISCMSICIDIHIYTHIYRHTYMHTLACRHTCIHEYMHA